MIDYLLVNMFMFGLITLVYVTLVFLLAQLLRNNSIMDIAYGPAFFIGSLGTSLTTGTFNTIALLMTGLIGLWATRLGVRIYRKNRGKPEDARYAAWRQAWMQKGYWYFFVRSYIQINLLQGLIIVLVAMPVIVATSSYTTEHTLFVLLGMFLFLFGLSYESLADYQLDQFLARKRNGTEEAVIMTSGLFAFSRRPNYFGETLIWWGLAVMALPLPFGWLAIISPLLITYIVTQVTGPMLEKIFLEKYPKEYSAYMATTSYFIPRL